MQITVKLNDGSTHEVDKFAPVDLVAFERHFKMAASAMGNEGDQRIEWLCFLVYRSLARQKVLSTKDTSFDSFLESIDDFDVQGDVEDDENPTPAAA